MLLPPPLPPPPLLLLLLWHPRNYRNFWEGMLTKNSFQNDQTEQQRTQHQTIYGPGTQPPQTELSVLKN
jgi:hypothetical protein